MHASAPDQPVATSKATMQAFSPLPRCFEDTHLIVVSPEEGFMCCLQCCCLWALLHKRLEVCEGWLAGALCALAC